MSFNTITHPTTGVRYSIFSSQGRNLLKSYLRTYKSGGAAPVTTKIDAAREAMENNMRKCEQLKQTHPGYFSPQADNYLSKKFREESGCDINGLLEERTNLEYWMK